MSFTLYNSSAGSGKTHSLIIEYLSIVLNNTSKYNRVLAVTFTNKAASEMKSRIIRYLVEISSGKMDFAVDDILKKIGKSHSRSSIKLNADYVLKRILHNYSDFAIMTIDSFIYKIVSTFSLELNLPLNFEVDMNTKQIVTSIVEKLIETADDSNYTGMVIKDFIFSKMDQSESWNYEKDIEDVGYELFLEKSIKYIDELAMLSDEELLVIIKKLKEKKFAFQNFIKDRAATAISIIEKADLEIDDFKYKKNGIVGKFYKLTKARQPRDFDPQKRFSEGDEANWVDRKSELAIKIEKLRDDSLESLRVQIVQFYNENIKSYLSIEAIIKDYSLTALIRKLKIILKDYKAENNIVPISDFNRIVSNIITKEIIPFIYWRIGDKFENYLLDEFQDTSSMQLTNLFPLIENSYSSGNKNIAVGDPKQSIYRWRDSNPEIMGSEIRKLVEPNFFISKKLEYNYRSQSNIIEFNNLFFSDILNIADRTEPPCENLYSRDNLVQKKLEGKPSSGYIEIYSIEEKLVKEESVKLAISRTVETIRSLNAEGYQFKDITILTRTNPEGSLIAEALTKEGIDVISPDSLFLNNSMEIRFIISVLKYIISKEKICLVEMVRFLQYDSFNQFALENSFNHLEDFFISHFPELFNPEISQQSSLYHTVEIIIKQFELNTKNCGYIQGFLEIVFNFSSREQNDIFSFLKFWDDKKDSDECSLIMPSGINAVSIMTIHKAKGLEFPIVMIPFANWNIIPDSTGFRKNTLWVRENGEFYKDRLPYLIELKKSLEQTHFSEEYRDEKKHTLLDNLNLLYVAFTRPISRLYICISNKKNSISEIIKDKIKEMELKKDQDNYYFGHKSAFIAKEEKDLIKLESHKTFNSEIWTDRVSIKENASGIWDNADNESDNIKIEKIKKGVIIHQLMSQLNHSNDKDLIIREAVYSGLIQEDQIKPIIDEINMILDIPFEEGKLSSLFTKQWKIYCEKPILIKGEILKPDRVVFDENRTIIIEYKTGIPRDEDKLQVKKYVSAIEQLGHSEISAYLVYIKDKLILKVSE